MHWKEEWSFGALEKKFCRKMKGDIVHNAMKLLTDDIKDDVFPLTKKAL